MESSYCYFIKTEATSNESLSNSNAEVLDSSNEDEESISKSESSELSSKSKIDDETINMIPSDINTLKKNLYNEEEFRSINHSEPIHIFLKIKPLSIQEIVKQKDEKYFKYHADTGVSVIPPKLSVYSQNKQSAQNLMQTIFHFSYVFQQKITQKDFFVATIYPCFEKFFNGENLLIFNYGVTNSGKTYTMQGTNTDPGLIPRSLDFLFESLKESSTNWQNASPDLGSNSVFRYKPDKFNEICSLSETELNQELLLKENILRLSNTKEMERFDSMRNLSRNFDGINASIELTKKFGSLDSLATIGNSSDPSVSDNNTASMLNKIKLSDNKKYAIWISFYELYNDSIYDLLAVPIKNARATLANNERPQLKIREDTNRIPYVEGLTHVPVFNTKEAIRVLKFGEKNLQKSSNSINANSSRSHAVFCLKIVSIDSTGKNQLIASINQLSFCDLAGIERNSKTQAVGKTQKEASFINQSLSSLSRCINTMMYNQKNRNNPQQIPYRVNKLTRLFQAYFEGKSMVKMIVNFNPSLTCFDESVGVLKFSSIANQIQLNLNDDKKVEYKIDINTNSPSKNSQTVAWDSDCGEEDEEDDDEDESGDESEEEDDSDGEEDEDDDESNSEESCEEDGESSVEAGEEESGEEVTENSSGDDEEEDDENGEEEDDDDEDEEDDDEEDENEEEDEENKTHNQTAKKTVRTNETTIQGNKSHSIKKSFQKTPAAKKPIHLAKLSATASKILDKKKTTSKSINKTISKANLSQLKSATYDDLNKDQLVALCKTIKKELDNSKKEFTKYESDLRNELVSTWSKRVEDTDSYYQEQIKIQRTQVEETFLKRMDMLEKLLNKKSEEKLDQLRQEKENELEKLREYQIGSSLEIRNLTEENDKLKKDTNRLLKLSDDLSEKLKEKIAEYELLVDKNNYITANLLNSTAINSSINIQSHKFVLPKNPVSAKYNESEIGCSLRLDGDDDEEEDEDEEESDGTEEEEEETEVEETQADETEVEEVTEVEETQADETEMEETEIEETQYEETEIGETMDQTNHSKSKLITFGEQNTQTESVATRSVEVEANIPDEEIARLKKIIDFKVDEIRILTEKIKSVENLNNQLNKILKAKSTQESEFTSKINQLEKELIESENSQKANEDQIKSLLSQKQQQTDLYDKLEIEFNKLTLSLEESKELAKRLETKLATFEKDNSQLKNEIAENQTSVNELTKDIAEKAKKLEKNLSEIDDLEKAIAKLTDDMEKKNFSYELLENDLQFKQNEVEKLTAELEESKALKLKIVDYNAVASKIRPSIDLKEEEKFTAPKVSIGSKSAKNEVKESTKESKSKSSDKMKKLSELKSIPEVKKSKLSKDRISVVNLSDDESKKADKRTSKSSKSTKPAKKTKDDDESDTESIVVEKDSKKKSKGGETSLDENNSTSLSAASSSILKPGQSNLTKKKSTLNRLTEMITKSPILEPLRKRPQRVANLKPSASNVSDNASILQISSNNISTASAKTSTLDKKTLKTKKASSSNLAQKIEDCENMNPEAVEPDNGRKTRKKKV